MYLKVSKETIMTDWSEGYISDVGYIYGYYSDLNPNNLLLPLLKRKIAMPKVKTACELGFGQGVSINVHAAANKDIEWWGTDFNPSHVSFAQDLANQSKSEINIFDQKFEDFVRDDLPDFDFICLHGIWSWISESNRKILVEFIRNKLKIGGVLYISYNTFPGWLSKAPLRHMLSEHADVMGARGESMAYKVEQAIEFTKDLINLSGHINTEIFTLKDQLERISKENSNYLAHEYFNLEWEPMYFSDIHKCLESAKINYICSSNYIKDFLPGLFAEEQLAFWAEIEDSIFAQTVKDYLLNTQFRSDLWVKGPRSLSQLQVEKVWSDLQFILVKELPSTLKIYSQILVTLNQDLYTSIASIFSDYKIHSFTELCRRLPDVEFNNLSHVIVLMHASGLIALVQNSTSIEGSVSRTSDLNQYIMENSAISADINFLASPVTGGAININQIQQIMILAYNNGYENLGEIVDFTWKTLQKNNQLIRGC